jgi:hypothetical protein
MKQKIDSNYRKNISVSACRSSLLIPRLQCFVEPYSKITPASILMESVTRNKRLKENKINEFEETVLKFAFYP